MFEVRYDEATGIVRVSGVGFQTVADARDAAIRIRLAAIEGRQRSGRVKMLIDSSITPVQPPEVIEEYHRHPTNITGTDDRMAVIVSSSLAKIQMKRNFRSDREQAFVSEKAAMDWLLATDEIGCGDRI